MATIPATRHIVFNLTATLALVLALTSVVDGLAAPASGLSIPTAVHAARAAATTPGHLTNYSVLSVTLPSVDPTEKAALEGDIGKGQPMQIGFGRPVPSPFQTDVQPFLGWVYERDGTETAVFTVTSPGAHAVRLALDISGLDEGMELYFFSISSPEQVFGPITVKETGRNTKAIANPNGDQGPHWSPVIEGETIGVVVRLTGSVPARGLVLPVVQVSHLVHSVLASAKNLAHIGRAGSCNIDVRCRNASDAIRSSTAKIVYTENGSSFLCTGTLLNDKDPDSFIPYFLTANHCFDTQSSASTVNTYWFFERAVCGGPNPTSVIQRAAGGELLATGTSTDFTFIQLNDEIGSISGNSFAGWDSSPLATSAQVVGVHHPMGDLKKWSLGSHTGFANFGGNVNATGTHERVVWSQGVTEGGSSGSGLFDTSDRFRGQLHGGGSSCSAPTAPDYYGRFDLSYPSISQWLNAGAMPITSGIEVTGTVQQTQWKEYKIRPGAGARLTVELYGLSQDADVYVRNGSRPTRTQYACRSIQTGAATDTCVVNTSGDGAYYIAVRGVSPGTTSFTLRATVKGGTAEPDAMRLFVSGFYQDVLGRSPEPAGLASWTSFLLANCNAAGFNAIGEAFFDSAEFRSRPLRLNELVTSLYRAFLDRDPDFNGLAAWAQHFRAKRVLLANQGFVLSAEFRNLLPNRSDRAAVTAVVSRFYTEILGRPAEPAGLNAWVNFVLSTGNLEGAAVSFITSAEFENGPLTFRGYITILYRAFLGRNPDAAGLDAWERALRDHLVDTLKEAFVPSGEFQGKVPQLCGP